MSQSVHRLAAALIGLPPKPKLEMRHYWMGEPIDDMPREKLLEVIDFLMKERDCLQLALRAL